jgi:4-alpha-glucanotransferase
MQISFHVNYRTSWGQRLCVLGSIPELGSWDPAFAADMRYEGEGDWRLDISMSQPAEAISYRYMVKTSHETVDEEWERNHHAVPAAGLSLLSLFDSWQSRPDCLAFYSAAFTEAVFSRPPGEPVSRGEICSGKIVLKVFAPLTEPGHSIAIAGNQSFLGKWNPSEAPLLEYSSAAEWTISIEAGTIQFPLEYKFLIVATDTRRAILWEEGDNRRLDLAAPGNEEAAAVSGLFIRRKMLSWRGSGIAVPVFSLRSEGSFGVGDLGDLRLTIEWASMTGQRFIQLLPMNDTTISGSRRDSYPYSAVSVYALHPMYVNLRLLGSISNPELAAVFEQKRRELNELDEVDYESVNLWKLRYCREIFSLHGQGILESEGFRQFLSANEWWIAPYAAWRYLRDLNGTADFSQWKSHSLYNAVRIRRLCTPGSEAWRDISFYYFLQYILYIQFSDVAAFARSRRVALKGDLPIGVNRLSVDAWTAPHYFNTNAQAGAPPDDFSSTGQNWSFPTYEWDAMERDGFKWWKQRFASMSAYFDSFRIDHILGFFRIWEIPANYIEGLCGHFNPALPLSVGEIESYGMTFNERRFTTPHIHRRRIDDLFGPFAGETLDSYLAQSSSQHYVLKAFCDTQPKIAAIFADRSDEQSIRIRSGLNFIACEVLFLRDPRQHGKFHPRISAHQSCIYSELSEPDRHAFNRLYNDFYYHRHDAFWKEQAYKRLTPLLRSARMLPCGEDLGMIPASVPEVMNSLQVLSLEIERMPKASVMEFTPLGGLPYMSVCTTSTHDMSPLRNWWEEEDKGKIQRYYNDILHCEGQAPDECTPDIVRRIVENHLASPSMLAIIPLQDWLAVDNKLRRPDCKPERINIPARPDHYWRYRVHIKMEDLMAAESLNVQIKCMIRKSGRE